MSLKPTPKPVRYFLPLIIFLIYSFVANAQLVADFSADKTGGCSPLAVAFTNQTSGASASAVYQWDFENGNTSGLLNPGAIFKNEQVYNVTLTVKDGTVSSSKTKQVTVYGPPVADFTASPVKGCLPVNVNFNATASGGNAGIRDYTWDFGDGNIQQGSGAVQSHTYTVPQLATVTLTVSNNFGCTKTIIKPAMVNILPAIQASFGASQTILCRVTDAVQFSNTSSGPGTLSYVWDFGDGTTSTLATPSHVFNVRGTYTVTLTVNSTEGCSATTIQNGFINVANFKTDFTVPTLICRDAYVSFTNISTPNPIYSNWLIDGQPAYNYNYTTLYQNFSVPGTHTIELKNTFGTCPDSATKTITIQDLPDIKPFIATTTGSCGAPLVYNFKDTTAGAVKWEWNFTSNYFSNIQSTLQAPTYTYTSDGGYSVWLQVTNAAGCTAATSQYISVTRPYVYITADGIINPCGPYSLTFTGNSTDSLINYSWYFGDGSSSTLSKPTHLFSNPGSYTITLTYKTLAGCTGTVSYGYVTVYTKPVANFTASATTICGNTPMYFTATNQGAGNYYLWDFGDNSNYYNYNGGTVMHQYYHDSVYTVSLIVHNGAYCADTITKTNYIKVLPPFPKILQALNTCDGNRGTVTFYQDSKKALSWKWDFGDGTSRMLNVDSPIVTHNYTATGTYKVLLTTTNGQCTVSDSTIVYVLLKQNPLLTGTSGNVCTNGQIQITINNLQNNPWPYSGNNHFYYFEKAEYNDLDAYNGAINYSYYYWGTTFNASLQSFDKNKTGVRTIIRSIGFGCADTTNFIPLTVKGSAAGFQILTNDICFKLPVVFKDTSKTNSKIISWQWNFGDGIIQTFNQGGIVNHIYANPGGYNVSLTITDTSGCTTSSNSQYQYVTVNGPKAAFNASANNTFITLPVYFYNYTNNYNSYNTEYKWTFGDGTSSTDYSTTHTYPLPGQYNVTLIATNPVTNCADTTSQIINVNNFAPAFSLSSTFLTANSCPPVLVRFNNNSINYTSVKWDFGDGNTADNLNYPAHIYEKPGKYIIKLYVYGPGGLTGTYFDSVIIKQSSASLQVDKKFGCIGQVVTLKAIITNASLFTWDFGDGNLSANSNTSISHQYNTAGIFKPSLMLTDTNGCNTFSSLNDSINIRNNPVVTITPAAPRICRGQPAVLTASGGVTYTWAPANGLSNLQAASPTANPVSTITYYVTAKDDIGCTGTGNVQVTVVQKQVLKLSADTAICLGASASINASGTDQYKWVLNTNGLSSTAIPNPIASPLTTTIYTLTGSDIYNCFTDTATVSIKVLPLPTVSIAAIPDVLLGTPIQIQSTYSNDVIQWVWTPADYLSCTNCPAPVSTPLAIINYNLKVTNRDGCTASADVGLKLQCQSNRVFIPTAFSPNDDGTNDVFSIKGISLVKHLIIYSRWGKPVYERNNFIASDRSTAWDGRLKGDPLPAGAYTYFAEMECPSGGSFVLKGTVMLLR